MWCAGACTLWHAPSGNGHRQHEDRRGPRDDGIVPDAPIPPYVDSLYAAAETAAGSEGKTAALKFLRLELTLEGDFKDFEEGGKEKQEELTKDVARNLGVPAERCLFVGARAGSVIADVKVVVDAAGGGPSLDELQQKSGALTGVALAGMPCKGVEAQQVHASSSRCFVCACVLIQNFPLSSRPMNVAADLACVGSSRTNS